MVIVYTILRSIKRSETSINPPFYETSFLRGLFSIYILKFTWFNILEGLGIFELLTLNNFIKLITTK